MDKQDISPKPYVVQQLLLVCQYEWLQQSRDSPDYNNANQNFVFRLYLALCMSYALTLTPRNKIRSAVRSDNQKILLFGFMRCESIQSLLLPNCFVFHLSVHSVQVKRLSHNVITCWLVHGRDFYQLSFQMRATNSSIAGAVVVSQTLQDYGAGTGGLW